MKERLHSKLRLNKSAFTIIELIVVIVILAILALLAMPRFTGMVDKAKLARITNDVAVVEKLNMKYLIDYEWEDYENELTMGNLIAENNIYDKRGEINKENVNMEKLYRNVPESVIKESNTKLNGDFLSDKRGEVIYVDDESNGNSEIEEEIEADKENSGNPEFDKDFDEWLEDLPDEYELAEDTDFLWISGDVNHVDFDYGEIIEKEFIEIINENYGSIENYQNIVEEMEENLQKEMESGKSPEEIPEEIMEEYMNFFLESQQFMEEAQNNALKSIEEIALSNGYYYYIGEDDYVVIPNEIEGNEVTRTYRMFGAMPEEPKDGEYQTHYGFSQSEVKGVASYSDKITDMSNMFEMSNAGTLDIKHINTVNVEDMSAMFMDTRAQYIDISAFNTPNLKYVNEMFSGAETRAITLGKNFNTSKVDNFSRMFEDLEYFDYELFYVEDNGVELENLNYLDTSNAKDMSVMFSGSQFNEIDLSNFNTSKVVDMSRMFSSINIKELSLQSFDTSNVEDMSRMFYNMKNNNYNSVDYMHEMALDYLDLSSFNTSKVKDMSGMFESAILKDLNISNFDTSNVEDMNYMFSGFRTEKVLDIRHFDTRNVIDMSRMFQSTNLKEILFGSRFNTSNVTGMSSMFRGAHIDTIDFSNFNTSNVESMSHMFRGAHIDVVDLSSFDTSKVKFVESMFQESVIKELNITSFDIDQAYSLNHMFYKADIPVLDLSSFDMENFKVDLEEGINYRYGMLFETTAKTIYAKSEKDRDILDDYYSARPPGIKYLIKSNN